MSATSAGERGPIVAPGTVIAGKYRIDHEIAVGGMGVVLAATHQDLGHAIAVKVMLPEAVVQEEAARRFLREARAAAHLTSEHIVRVFDVGTLDNGLPYMVMEKLVGCDLSDLLAKRGPLPVAEAVGFAMQALAGLAEAHERGIVHRDLKPSNLFVVESTGRLKILDFGISKIIPQSGPLASGDATRTATQQVMGSPMYMSPEQVRSSKDVDQAADIWSMGVILYELLTAKMLFSGESIGALFAQILTGPIPLVTAARRDVPSGLAREIARCLDRDSSKRPTAAVLRKRLAQFASEADRASLQGGARRASDPGNSVSPARTQLKDPAFDDTAHAHEVSARSRALRRGAPIGIAVIAAAVAIGVYLHRGPEPAPIATSEPSGATTSSSVAAPTKPDIVVVAASADPTQTASANTASGAPVPPPSTSGSARPKASTAPSAKKPKVDLNQRD